MVVFVPPFDKSGAPVLPPVVTVIGWANAVNAQNGAANVATGLIVFSSNSQASARVGGAVAATGIAPFLQSCFEVQKSQRYDFLFDFSYAFTTLVTGSLWKGKSAFGTASLRVIAEIFDQNGQLLGDNFTVLASDIYVPLLNGGRPYAGASTLGVSVALGPGTTYYWKFTVHILTSAMAVHGKITKLSSTGDVTGAGAGNSVTLRSVTVAPDVYPTHACP